MSLAAKLVEQYKEHGKLIIAYDFDDTVFPYSHSKVTPIIREVLKTLRMAKEQGHTLVLYTCRDREDEVKLYCELNDIHYDYFNDSPVTLREGPAKIYYNVFLDDKCGLREATKELQIALYEIKNLINS